MTWHIMVAEIFTKNRFDALLRPIVGINYDRNAPLIKANDTGEGQQNGTVLRSWLFLVLRHVIWQEMMRRAPLTGHAPYYGDKIGRCLLSNEHQRDERR